MYPFFSKFPPLLVSRRNTDSDPNKTPKLSPSSSASLCSTASSASFCSTSSSCSVSSDHSFDLTSRISLRRLPTFSYFPSISKRRLRSHGNRPILPHRSNTFPSLVALAPEDEEPATPASSIFSSTDSVDQYVSFPSLESLDNANYWDDHQAQLNLRRQSISELEMERYDEMLVGGVMIKY